MKDKNNILKIITLASIIVTFFSCNNMETKYTPEREAEITAVFINLLISKDYDVDTTNIVVYYVITEEGESNFVQPGDSIDIIYTGFSLKAQIFLIRQNICMKMESGNSSIYRLI
jgi:hypothetical protein